MGNCLITTLPDSCTDTSIRKLGEFRFNVISVSGETSNSRAIEIAASDAVTVTANDGGFFTASKGSASIGTSVTIPASDGITTIFYPGNGDYTLSVTNKYAITRITLGSGSIGHKRGNLALDLTEMRYMTGLKTFYAQFNHATRGDIANFKDSTALKEVWIDESLGETYGNISTFANFPNLTILYFYHKGGSLTGNLSALASLTKLTTLVIDCDGTGSVTGNLSSLSALTALTGLNLSNHPGITGNLTSLYNCTGLKSLRIPNTGITGDLAALKQRCTQLTTVNVTGTAVTNVS